MESILNSERKRGVPKDHFRPPLEPELETAVDKFVATVSGMDIVVGESTHVQAIYSMARFPYSSCLSLICFWSFRAILARSWASARVLPMFDVLSHRAHRQQRMWKMPTEKWQINNRKGSPLQRDERKNMQPIGQVN